MHPSPASPLAGSRSLLLPGPQPPLSHFGVTLLRHVVTTGIRYALHSLDVPVPEGAPTRIVRLRLYLDREKLEDALAGAPAAQALIGALLEPGGTGSLPADAGGTRGALRFHRLRLRVWRRRPSRRASRPAATTRQLWREFRALVTRQLPALNDALLGELVAALDRRAARVEGARPDLCLGPQAFALRTTGLADLSRLGAPDPLAPAWSEAPAALEHLVSRARELPQALRHPLRGGFREAYRRAIQAIKPSYLKLAEAARASGHLEQAGDAFFIPFDLTEDLAAERFAAWLTDTVASNRREYQGLLDAPSPPERVGPGPPRDLVDDRDDWALGPLWPLE